MIIYIIKIINNVYVKFLLLHVNVNVWYFLCCTALPASVTGTGTHTVILPVLCENR
jgi:hypothetical protein